MKIVDENGVVVGSWFFSALDCSRVVHSHDMAIDVVYRGKGHGKRSMADRLAILLSKGFRLVTATVNATNAVQLKLMYGYGWRKVGQYEETDGTVYFMIRDLSEPIEYDPTNHP